MKTKYALLILSLVLGCSCTDFLDESNPSNFTQQNYFKTAEHARSVVNSIYADLRYSANGDYGGNPYFMTDFLTGLAGTKVSQNVNINNIRLVVNNSDNEYSKSWWNYAYRAIANANLAITYIPGIEMDKSTKSKCLGEAYFLRAYNYFNLVRLFGSVPLVLVPVDASSPELYPQQASTEEVYNSILSDLKQAEESDLGWTDETGRVTKATVKSLLANVYLTMAGYPMEKGKEYYALAASKAKEVIDNGSYKLFSSYSDLHNIEMENKGEHLFMIQYQSGIVENPFQSLLLPYNMDVSYYSTETGSVYALDEFINTYEEGDKRTEEGEFYYTQFTSNANREEVVKFGGYYIYKFFDMDAHLNTAKSSLNYPLLRYADLLLMYAEAQNEAEGGPSATAYACVNQIRQRANLKDLSGLSQEDFRYAVWKERYHELAFENKIWFDMARTRKVLNLATGKFDDYVGHKFTYGPVLSSRELLFPIPTNEIKNNKNLKQNDGY
ncbi:RagB/SusD family nutrient uptake outer membrane protein [Parabacteroides sp.]|uniref:RagB/SusD family nutrient uptake outer membrane protein n=1 Tax=Parabacteroides sp. TaxID=1869337 RepID=UPI0030808289